MENKFISVIAKFSENGVVVPQTILWEDGRKFSVDKIMDIRRCASIKVGGVGIRYHCKVHGKEVFLYRDEDSWFIES